ncbi:MAG: response regulator [Thermoproteota archaeon]|jgi:DNA-binding NtrC family response regulator|nr:response regulator [Thermoproteota archaeon]
MKKKEGDAENRSKGRLLVNKTSMRILVVDDEPDINTTLEKALEQNGFKVDSYECPLMALENFTPHYYDLAILDIKMPEMNGFSFYREIKKLDKNLRICFLTAGEMYYGVYSDIFSLYLLTISFESLLAMKI